MTKERFRNRLIQARDLFKYRPEILLVFDMLLFEFDLIKGQDND